MKKLTLITNNENKIKVAKSILSKHNIKLEIASLDQDPNFQEVQLWNCEDIALFSARYACQKLNKAVLISDVGYYFETFGKGFPGPYIKWFNEGLTSEDILNLMKGKENRKVLLKEALAYCDPLGNEKAFLSEDVGHISLERSENKGWSAVNEVLILKGMDKPLADYTSNEIIGRWSSRNKKAYVKLVEWLENLKS